ncbi:MAG: hypothetical protein KAR06_03855 [Deltaproteobacteria bacterium]|nr:hypothetical protein [Deltaproteobacteria bacterium]
MNYEEKAALFRKKYWKHIMPPSPWIKRIVIDEDGFAIGYGDGIDKVILGRAWY